MRKVAKKAVSILLCIIMVLSVSSTVFAEERENLALNKPAQATDGNAARALDGDITTYWDGGVAPSELTVDLKDWYEIEEINVVPYYGGSRYYHYEVYVSENGISFQKVGEKKDNTIQTSEGQTFKLDNIPARYVKVLMIYNSANPSVHINELRVYGTKIENYPGPEMPTVDPEDPDNVAYGKPTWSTTNSNFTMAVVDGNRDTFWAGEDYPKFVDIDLQDNYNISEVRVYMPVLSDSTAFTYTVYGSKDGVNFTRIAGVDTPKVPTAEGDSFTFEDPVEYRVIRVNVTSNSRGQGASSMVSEVKVFGEKSDTPVTKTRTSIEISSYKDWMKQKYGIDLDEISDENGRYDIKDTFDDEDVFNEIKGIITRLLGEEYVSWFSFELAENPNSDGYRDYYEISNKDGKIHIKGNVGVSITAGLNHYLKYYCDVHISQQTSQVNMPDEIVPVEGVIHKECPYEVRYAYNYCTLSYTMPFWGYDEWQRELDYFALNGVNLILDTTATEALWVRYLMNYGYSVDEAKAFVCGYSYKAWWLMGNLESYGGPVSDQWIIDTVEMARVNQRKMTVLGMQPCLQGFMGALPTNFQEVANDTLMNDYGYEDITDYLVPQGNWSGFDRPILLKTTYDGYDDMAAKFYEEQEYIYGQVTDYYAGDLAHEGGVLPPDLSKAEMSAHILEQMIKYDPNAVWVIQSWLSNPDKEVLQGFGDNREEHVLVLDLDATVDPHWNNTTRWNGKEFGGTSWVYCMLDNYGGRTGLHGELLTIATQIPYALKNSSHMKGIGITPEGTQLNPVKYDLFWEMAWETDSIDLDDWIKNYITRRYGEFSESCYEGWQLLLETVYGYCNSDGSPKYHTGNNNCITNMRPSFSPEIVIGSYQIEYDPEVFERAVSLIMKDFDRFKGNECYIYDVVDLLRQNVANTQVAYHGMIVDAYNSGNYQVFKKYKDKLLKSILLLDEISSYEKDSLVGTWISKATNFYSDPRNGEYDDYSKEMMVINAKAIVSAWSSKTLQTYGHRQYSGMLADYNYPMWKQWLDALDEAMVTGEPLKTPTSGRDYFNAAWNFVINGKDYPTTPSNVDGDSSSRGLKAIYEDIRKNYLFGQVEKDKIIDDNIGKDGVPYADSELSSGMTRRINDGDTSQQLWIAASPQVPVSAGIMLSDYYDIYEVQLFFEKRSTPGANVMNIYVEAHVGNGVWKRIYTGQTYDPETQRYFVDIMLDELLRTNNIRITFTSNGGIYPAMHEMKIFSSRGIMCVENDKVRIENKVLKGVADNMTVQELCDEYLYHGNGELVFKDKEGNILTEEDRVTDGTIIQLVYNDLVLDELLVEAEKVPVIVNIEPVTVTTEVGEAPNLPTIVTAVFSDGTTAEVAVEWEEIDPAKYQAPGTFTVEGTVEGTDIKARANIVVGTIPELKPFTITPDGNLDRTAGIKAAANVKLTPGAPQHQGREVVLFQLMKATTPINLIALEKDITIEELYIAHFSVEDYEDISYSVKVFVFDRFDNDLSAPKNLAEPVKLQ